MMISMIGMMMISIGMMISMIGMMMISILSF